MEMRKMKLDIYEDRFCRKIARTLTAQEFELSTAICEDVLDIVKIDLWEGGLSALSTDSQVEIVVGIVKDALPYFKEFMAELFEVSPEELRYTKIKDIALVVIHIVRYSVKELKSSFGKGKN
jgi:hypothetical protein